VAVTIDTNNSLWGTIGYDLKCLDTEFEHLNVREFDDYDDIADLMQKRAITDYGQITDIQRNGELAQNPILKPVWQLLAHMTRKDGMLGLKTILGVSNSIENPSMSRSESMSLPWHDFPDSGVLKIYK
jgi:WD repeat-containing protein mio